MKFSWKRMTTVTLFTVSFIYLGFTWYTSTLQIDDSLPDASEVQKSTSEIIRLIEDGDFETVVKIIRENPKLVFASGSGQKANSIIHRVTVSAQNGLFEALLDIGVDDELLSLRDARASCNPFAIRYLLERGADPNDNLRGLVYLDGRPASFEVANLLLDFGVDPEASNTILEVTKSLASNELVIPLMKRLLEAGASPNVGEKARTPLVASLAGADRERFDLLLQHGADIHYNQLHLTQVALFTAKRIPDDPDHVYILKTLIERGASVDVPYTDGKSVRSHLLSSPQLREALR